jgi:hypothetical protein
MEEEWVVTEAEEWEVAVEWCLSVLVTGSVAPKAVDITILPKTFLVFDVVLAVRVQPLWLTLGIHLQWTLPRTMAWAQDQWLAHLAQGLSHLLQVDLDLAAVTAVSTSADPQAPTLFHLALERPLAHTLR